MSKVLYINHGFESTGVGEAGRNYVLAMDQVGIDVVMRPIKLGTYTPLLPDKIKELSSKSSVGCDVCIQHVLPHHMFFDGRFKKNIALLVVDTLEWFHSGWHREINQFDELWVPNQQIKDTAQNNRVKIPIRVIPHCFDLSKYYQKYDRLDFDEINGNFVFYTISEFNRRKRLLAIIEAFHLEFSVNEPVSLLIKTHKPNTHPNEIMDSLNKECDTVKSALKLYPKNSQYHNELLITRDLPTEEIYKLHNTCDCFVSTSFGEGWNIPLFEAMAFGKHCIAGNEGGPQDFLKNYSKGALVNGKYVPVTGMNDTFFNLHSGREKWFSVDISEISKAMRKAYEHRSKPSNHIEVIKQYSYENVGKIMLEAIN